MTKKSAYNIVGKYIWRETRPRLPYWAAGNLVSVNLPSNIYGNPGWLRSNGIQVTDSLNILKLQAVHSKRARSWQPSVTRVPGNDKRKVYISFQFGVYTLHSDNSNIRS